MFNNNDIRKIASLLIKQKQHITGAKRITADAADLPRITIKLYKIKN